MTPPCASPIADERWLDYWTGAVPLEESAAIEEHLFSCAECSTRLEAVTSLGAGVAALARQGRITGIISRSLLNRLQRDGVRVRQYTLDPGETVPCAAFAGDDVIVTSLNANLAGVRAVSLSVRGAGGTPIGEIDDVPVSASAQGVMWATPGAIVRAMPSQLVHLTLRSADDAAILGEYVLDHSGHAG